MDQLSFEFVESFIDKGIKLNKLGKFKTKICTKCKIEKEANRDNFSKSRDNKDNLESWCRECKNKQTLKYVNSKKEKGVCKGCNKKALPNRSMCAYHTVDNTLRNQQKFGRFTQLKTKGEMKTFIIALLQKLEDQKHKCAITGIEILLGDNAHLDHIQEKCNGGSCELNNLQWVSATANLSKPRKYKEESESFNENLRISNL